MSLNRSDLGNVDWFAARKSMFQTFFIVSRGTVRIQAFFRASDARGDQTKQQIFN